MAIAPDSIFLDTDTDGTLQTQIKRQIVSHILSGQFRPATGCRRVAVWPIIWASAASP